MNRREQGQLGNRRTHDATRRATNGDTYASTVTCVQEAHDIGTRGARMGGPSACCGAQLAAAYFLPARVGKEVRGNGGLTEVRAETLVRGACDNAPRRAVEGELVWLRCMPSISVWILTLQSLECYGT